MPPRENAPGPDGPILIKKYGNRRLYDTRQSRYITLEDLAGIVQAGAMVQVVDSTTSKDLTRQVLMQVLLEQQDSLDVVPVELLHAVLRVQGTLEQGPFAAFLSAMTGQFVERGNLWAKQLVDLMGSFPMAGMAGLGGMAGFPGMGGPGAGAARSAPPTRAGDVDDDAADGTASSPEQTPPDDLREVRSRMDALLHKMKKQ
jgi:polyhydroxyalkanoate synthesis repressor PhaR